MNNANVKEPFQFIYITYIICFSLKENDLPFILMLHDELTMQSNALLILKFILLFIYTKC